MNTTDRRPTGPRIGSLFTGYGGLDLGVQDVLGGTVAWHADPAEAPARVLAHHWPAVPNLGDVAATDWSAVEPVDVLTGGFPCQDVSTAGRRAGLRAGTRSGLWSAMADAIDHLRPALVVAENVRGLLSASADGVVEPCPYCVGDRAGTGLRALGAVLGDLADLGFDAQWCGLRAADVGAPHGRFRVFLVAWPTGDPDGVHRQGRRAAGQPGEARPAAGPAPDADRAGGQGGGRPAGAEAGRRRVRTGPVDGARPTADAVRDRREGRPERDVRSEAGVEAPRRADPARRLLDWGAYEPAVRRWELILGRPAPAPTQTGRRGSAQLSAPFVEWLMGLPEGHVTAVPGLTRNDQLRALGNGVVPRQAAAAVRRLLAGLDGQIGVAA